MKVDFTPRARRRARAVAQWWQANAAHVPHLFDEELAEVIEKLAAQSTFGREYETVRGVVMRRVLLRRSEQHVYYSVDDAEDRIVIHTIWGARRGRPPKL